MKFLRTLPFLLLIGYFPVNAAEILVEQPGLEEQVLQVLQKNPEVIVDIVERYQFQQQEKVKLAREEFLQKLKDDPGSIIGNSPVLGAEDSEITLVEFSDFQCPFCSKSNQVVQSFLDENHNRVRLVYKNLPLSEIHPEALAAARAAWAAGQQGKFWEYHDALFESQESLGNELYLEMAKNLGLEIDQFTLDREKADEQISKDIELANSLGINGAPLFVMSGKVFRGDVTLEELESHLSLQL